MSLFSRQKAGIFYWQNKLLTLWLRSFYFWRKVFLWIQPHGEALLIHFIHFLKAAVAAAYGIRFKQM